MLQYDGIFNSSKGDAQQVDALRALPAHWREKTVLKAHPGRLQLACIDESLRSVEQHWQEIDDELARRSIGRKDTPFNAIVRTRMSSAYSYLDDILAQQVPPFSKESLEHMLALNNRVHYGTDLQLMSEYASALAATAEKFQRSIGALQNWYDEHTRRGDNPLKIAAEIYVSILGRPQLFIEGNHRAGSLIADWINVYYGLPPFVLSVENAIAYFAPSAEIKSFADKSSWRGRARLPKYRKSFLAFWQRHIDSRYLLTI
jgi:hypothetical protein